MPRSTPASNFNSSLAPIIRSLVSRWTTMAGIAILLGVIAMAATAGFIFPDDPWTMVARPLLWPGEDRAVPLGSDLLGRDILAGIFYGARVSLWIGLAA